MAKFLNTTGVSYHLEELIKNTTDQLILISPYLQFSERIKEHIQNLYIQKCDIRIIYRENKLQLDENNWLGGLIGVRTSLCKNLHAKCYLNKNEAIITSMNLYAFSQSNNNEMGIYVKKEDNEELFNQIQKEAKRLLTISDEIRVSIKKVVKSKTEQQKEIKENHIDKKKKDYSKSKYKSISALAKQAVMNGNALRDLFEEKEWIIKEGKSWVITDKGSKNGGQMKKGQYGKYTVWPEEIIKEF